jgi:hypothetical protein
MNADQAWQSALGQLQMEMPKSSFDTWVQDTQLVSFNDGLFTVGARNSYARDWLDSRLSSTVKRLLMGIMNQPVEVEFVVSAGQASSPDLPEEDPVETQAAASEGVDTEFITRTAYCTLYDKIVQPRTVIVVERYLVLRLLPWIGARAFWMYIGFHQAAWMNLRGNVSGRSSVTTRLAAPNIARFAGVGRATLFRWMKDPDTWKSLRGLVKRTHLEAEWDEDHGGNMHKLANEYIVSLTPPLSWADAYSIYGWLAGKIADGASLEEALEAALNIPNDKLVGELLQPLEQQPSVREMEKNMPQPFLTVMDIARDLSVTGALPESTQAGAELVHTKIVHAFGDVAIKVYFVETVIPQTKMSPEQAALVVATRCRTYTNESTGEVRNRIAVPRGCAEMGSWVGIAREKTVWEWINGEVRRVSDPGGDGSRKKRTEKDVGPIPGFLKIEYPNKGVDRTPQLYVRLMEPVFRLPAAGTPDGGFETVGTGGLGTKQNGGSGTIKDGGHAANRTGGLETIRDGGDGHPDGDFETVEWRTWDVLNDLKYLLTTFRIRTSKSPSIPAGRAEAVDNFSKDWDLKKLLYQSEVYPANIKKLTDARVTPEQFIAWLLYTMSPYGQRMKLEPVRMTVKSLLEDPAGFPPAPVFAALARLPKHVLYELIKTTPQSGEGVITGNDDWDKNMGLTNPKIDELRKALFGE